MDMILYVIVLLFGYIGIFGIGLTIGILFKDRIEWSKLRNENNKKNNF